MTNRKNLNINDFGYTKLDFITYGNSSYAIAQLMNEKISFDHLFKRYSKIELLKNSSNEVKIELLMLKNKVNEIAKKTDILAECILIETDLHKYICEYFEKNKIVHDAVIIKNIMDDVYGLCMKIKYYHNHPRPYQIANWINVDLFPHVISATPSFPSLSVFQTKIVCGYVSVYNTENKDAVNELVTKVSESRLYLGVNTTSNVYLTNTIAANLLDDEVFFNKFHKKNIV
jgi:hypothetical protein